MGRKAKIEIGKIINTNSGPMKIIEDIGYNKNTSFHNVLVEFINTGSRYIVNYYNAIKGEVKDHYAKVLFGVACKGNVSCTGNNARAYSLWFHMISRCYNINDSMFYAYGERGIRVCDRWLCFENFLNDIQFLENYDKWLFNNNYQIDKDEKQFNLPDENKIYSPDTCKFIIRQDNISIRTTEKHLSNKSKSKFYGVNPSGNNFQVYININGINTYFGTYTNEEAAAVIYNHYAKINHKPLINIDIDMHISEALTYRSNYSNRKNMCSII